MYIILFTLVSFRNIMDQGVISAKGYYSQVLLGVPFGAEMRKLNPFEPDLTKYQRREANRYTYLEVLVRTAYSSSHFIIIRIAALCVGKCVQSLMNQIMDKWIK